MYLKIKNSIVGFSISFIGSIPLGYLNIMGLHYFKQDLITSTLFYLLGVVIIESLVIFFTAKGVSKINLTPHLKTKISLFSIAFLLLLSYLAKQSATPEESHNPLVIQIINYPFITGIILSSLNFSQIPFWLSWNLYILNEKYANFQQNGILSYTIGASLGTFIGMLSLIVFLDKTVNYTQLPLQNYIPKIFVCLAIWQAFILIKNKNYFIH
ncbi:MULTISPECIES: LysE family transporter [Flavobacterium]|uniref:LysE type translocator n=2 Tax=Flavobacterium TaxID=237 RepID=A0A2N9PBX9_9FLAO|nr:MULTISPECIES: LysE family transporter [Flavobacterium]QYS89107.1 LysE family transporter [Flavobacterium davisii]RVU90298.1 hypothetical protein EH230_04935 [Flavobacterium columnare]SPE77837.1 LysE type translocator [Flavobacterium columnare]